MAALRMNKMLSINCLGTQELHTFYKTTEILEDSTSQEIAVDKAVVGSTLICHQDGNLHISSLICLVRLNMIVLSLTEFWIFFWEIVFVLYF